MHLLFIFWPAIFFAGVARTPGVPVCRSCHPESISFAMPVGVLPATAGPVHGEVEEEDALTGSDAHADDGDGSSASASSASSEGDRRAFGVRQALPLGGQVAEQCDSDYDVDDEARAAAEYLAAVRAEAAAGPRTVVAAGAAKPPPPPPPLEGGTGAPPPPPPPPAAPTAADAVAPDDPWLVPFLESFAAVRAAVADARSGNSGMHDAAVAAAPPTALSLPRDQAGWAAALGSPPPAGLAETLPHPHLVSALERVAAASGGPAGVGPPGWARRAWQTAPPPPPPPHPARPLPACTPTWAFALAAGLERPLTPDACAALRSLGRAAGAAARAVADAAPAANWQPLPPAERAALAEAAIVAAIAGAYFAQDEALCVVAREGWP